MAAQPVEVPGLLQADTASPALGVVAGATRYTPEGTCFAVVDALARSGDGVWDTCDHRLGPFSASGTYVVGIDRARPTATARPTITVLDAATGEEVVDLRGRPPAPHGRRVLDPDGLGGRRGARGPDVRGDDYYMMRLGLDGSVQRIGIPSAGLSGLKVAVPS